MKKFLALSVLMVAFGVATFGQVGVNVNTTASATIVAPIAMVKNTDMNFGNVAVNATAGTVVLAPAGTRTATGGVTLPAVFGTVSAATFTVTGTTGAVYTISLPASAIISFSGNDMTVNNFTSTPTPTGTLTGGTSALSVGATLNVNGGQAAGLYTSVTPFVVNVNYN